MTAIHKKPMRGISRRGFTLVELLVVIVILGLVTAATIPLMQPATAQRRMREASRMVATVLANAQARALATGRPVGVMFQRQATQKIDVNDKRPHHSIEIFLCEVPPPYIGDVNTSGCRVKAVNQQSLERVGMLYDSQPNPPSQSPLLLPPRQLREGDRIRLNYRGYLYSIEANPNDPDANLRSTVDAEGYITGRSFRILPQNGVPAPVNSLIVPYQIYLQPRKTADPPAQMPVGSVVDLEYAGVASGWLGGIEPPRPPVPKLSFHHPVIVLFGPAGNFEAAYWGVKNPNSSDNEPGMLVRRPATTGPFFILIGQPMGDAAVSGDVIDQKKNHINFDSVWIAINPQSGLVTTSEVGSEFDLPPEPDDMDVSKELDNSRALAKTAQNMTGR